MAAYLVGFMPYPVIYHPAAQNSRQVQPTAQPAPANSHTHASPAPTPQPAMPLSFRKQTGHTERNAFITDLQAKYRECCASGTHREQALAGAKDVVERRIATYLGTKKHSDRSKKLSDLEQVILKYKTRADTAKPPAALNGVYSDADILKLQRIQNDKEFAAWAHGIIAGYREERGGHDGPRPGEGVRFHILGGNIASDD